MSIGSRNARSRPRAQRSIRPAGILPGCALALGLGLMSHAQPMHGNELPSVKDALAQEVRGATRLSRKLVQISYDFRKPDQAQDFVLDQAGVFTFGGELTDRAPEHPTIERGVLQVPRGKQVRARLPLDDIQSVVVRAQGVSGLSIQLSQGRHRVMASFADYPHISIDNGGGSGGRNRLNLQPEKAYRFELLIQNGKATGKLDGKVMMEEPLPKDLGPLSDLRVGSGRFGWDADSAASITLVQIAGTVAEELPLIAVNRDRGKQRLPPVWNRSFTEAGDAITAVSPISQEHAASWSRRLNEMVALMLHDYPPTTAAPPEPPPGEPGVEVPADRRPPEYRYQRTLYLFDSSRVLQAYAGSSSTFLDWEELGLVAFDSPDAGDPRDDLPEELQALLAPTSSVQMRVHWRVAGQVLAALYPTLPSWWGVGNVAYYSLSFGGGDPAAYSKEARSHLASGKEPRLSELLGGWTPSTGSPAPISLAWAWIHFLRNAESGRHAGLLTRFHEALRAGKSAEQAGQEVFPTALFNELYPAFEKYLQAL